MAAGTASAATLPGRDAASRAGTRLKCEVSGEHNDRSCIARELLRIVKLLGSRRRSSVPHGAPKRRLRRPRNRAHLFSRV